MKIMNRSFLSPAARLMLATWFVALAGLAASLAQAQPMAGPHGPMDRHGAFAGPMIERQLDRIGASTEQKSRIRDIFAKAAEEQKAQREAQRSLRDEALGIFTQPNVDARAAEALRQKMMAAHEQSSRRWMQAMLDASAMLTPEQRGKLAEQMKQRRDLRERHQRERRALETPKS